MHRHLFGVPLQSMVDSLCKSKLPLPRQSNIAGDLGLCRSIASSNGYSVLGYGEGITTNSIQKQIVEALFQGERGRASNLLSELCYANSSLRVDDFVSILKYCARSPDPLFAMETWRILEEKEINFNNISCLLMVQALCKAGYLAEAYNLINFIGEKHGTHPSLAVCNCFLAACSRMKDFVHANKCLDLMERRMLGKNETTYMLLLELAVHQQNVSAVHEIWKDCIKHYSPQILSLQKFIRSFTRFRDLKSAYEIFQYLVSLACQGNTSICSADGSLYSSRLDIPIPAKVEVNLQIIDLKERNEHSALLKAETCCSNVKSISNVGKKEVGSVGGVEMDEAEFVPVMKILKSSFGDIIHACVQSKKFQLAEHLKLQMQNLGVQPSSHTYDSFIRAVILKGCKSYETCKSEGMELLKDMLERNLKPYNSTLAMLSMACCKVSELDMAETLLDQISHYGDPRPFNIFFEECDYMDQPERAIRMLAKMKQLKIQPVIRTYELLFSLFGNVNAPYERGNMASQVDCAKRINAIEMDMANNGVRHSHISINNLLTALAAEGMVKEVIQHLQRVEDLFHCSDTYLGMPIYNRVLHTLVKANETRLAIEIFKNVRSSGLQLNAATYTTMIDCYSRIRSYKSASALLSLMLRNGFYPQIVTYTALIKVPMAVGNFDEALIILDQFSSEGIKPDRLFYNSIIKKARFKGRIDVIELIVERMHREKIKPNAMTCYNVFRAYLKWGFPNTAMEALQVLSMRMMCKEDDDFENVSAKFEDDYVLAEDEEAESRILKVFGGKNCIHIAAALLNLRWCAINGFQISWSPNENLWARRLSTNYDMNEKIAT